ncbi:DUF899 domain-containing protein [Thermobifida halotolerans]|uniref:DUF899 domain-containing protein n=1 Tax=Thermobifida halotolerans TaxID=483545 RepID=A0A399G4U3_9ACTN|nr:DUF899 domain-containing protein [Thermobifida halotolerans]UOE21117.1 DUF899 domain-containing protein [Thermobifida halotolerans]
MALSKIVSRDEWLAARRDFLAKEKEFTRARDALNAQRRELPRVLVDKDYVFDSPEGGKKSLLDLFEGRRQLVVYHFMSPPETGEFCVSCSFWVDNIGHLAHLHARDTTLVVDCPVPLDRIERFKKRMGWTVPWVSSQGSDFYRDLHFAVDGPDPLPPGVSAFVREGDRIFHSYSTHNRGSDLLNTTYNYLDITPLGRQEEGLRFKQEWVRYHDCYDA